MSKSPDQRSGLFGAKPYCIFPMYAYNGNRQRNIRLQGGVQVPTGGYSPRAACRMNRCDSGTDSIVWMEEDVKDGSFAAPKRGELWCWKGVLFFMKKTMDTKKLATMAMLAALAFVVMSVTRLPLMAAAPFLKYDPKDVILVIGGFLYGPAAAAAMSLVVCLMEMFTLSESGIVGFAMNFLASAAFICPAAMIYQKRRTIGGAVAGLLCGVVLMTGTMLMWNWIITPFYQKIPREAVETMLIPVFLPFNAVKGSLNMALAVLLYQPINNALRRLHLLPALPDGKVRRRLNPTVLAFGAVLLVVCVVIVLKMLGKI